MTPFQTEAKQDANYISQKTNTATALKDAPTSYSTRTLLIFEKKQTAALYPQNPGKISRRNRHCALSCPALFTVFINVIPGGLPPDGPDTHT
jgi:hypothetical protein